ncbi:MAG: N-acetyl-alpha-D-glucosaminyl L-malate synthase BshA [Longimicrobiales bacterium]|nr:N-acetyl-alpha-D-glucosaminyl L-malate synthase BshA [Longimicrobiales bacterium]
MKIGITCYPTYGGSGAVATELGMALAERGHEIHFVSYDQPFRLGGFQERVFFHEVEMEDYPLFEHPPYALALAVALHDAARNHELDLVHMHYAIPHAASAYLARQMLEDQRELKIVTTLHGTDITLVGLHPSFHEITRFSILQSDGLTAVSSYLRDETVRDFAVPAERIEIIPNFIDVEAWRPGLEPCHRATLAPGGEKIIMHVSNFRPVKRVTDVIETFARLSTRVESRLVMVGDGPDRPRAERRARALGIRDKVLFLGKHQSVEELVACADLFLLPSQTESFGLAALEAMACGVPVVASLTGGLPEVIDHGESGFLLEVGDVDAMADAGARLLTDDALHDATAEKARAAAVERFSAEAVVPRYEEYYRRVAGGEVSGGPERTP